MPFRRVLVWGAGGHGRVIADLIVSLGWELAGFVDGDPEKMGSNVAPFEAQVIATEEALSGVGTFPGGAEAWVPGIGDNGVRLAGVRSRGARCAPAIVHPNAVVSPFAVVGRGTVVLAGAVINAGAAVGEGVIINTGVIVEHDCRVGDGAHLSPGAVLTGGVSVGSLSWIGANATVLPGLVIGDHVTVGAGAVVRRDLDDHITAAGNPARIIHRKKQ